MRKILHVLGTRGVPAQHGGFESFAENLAKYLVRRGWTVYVYCQLEGKGESHRDVWEGVHRVLIGSAGSGPLATIAFDLKATVAASRIGGVMLVLGYNTAIFGCLHKVLGQKILINMDGLEWARSKWGAFARIWFLANESIACWLADHLIADHPGIESRLREIRGCNSPISMIPYGAHVQTDLEPSVLEKLGVRPREFFVVIARPEPENSILEIVRAFSEKRRGHKLVVLGKLDTRIYYHRQILEAASEEVLFPGAIYDQGVVASLRFYSTAYIHGHTVGGTNPSLVEAMAAGSCILAHDNKFNRWVAGVSGALFFDSVNSCSDQIEAIITDPLLKTMVSENSKRRFKNTFYWENILSQYEATLELYL